MPLQVYTPRWRDLLNRLFVGKRQGIEDLVILDDVFPTISLTDATQGEYHLLRGEYTWSVGITVPAYGVGRFGQVVFNNPVGSGFLVIVERVAVNTTGAFTTRVVGAVLINGAPAPATLGVPQRTDSRGQAPAAPFYSSPPPAMVCGLNDAAASLAPNIFYAAPGQNADTDVLAHDVILKPGSQLVISLDGVSSNLAYGLSANGYDRAVEPEDIK